MDGYFYRSNKRHNHLSLSPRPVVAKQSLLVVRMGKGNELGRASVSQVHRIQTEDGKLALKFQHPTLAGPGNFGGWFEEQVLGPKGEEWVTPRIPTLANITTAPSTPTSPSPTLITSTRSPRIAHHCCVSRSIVTAPVVAAPAPPPGAKVFTMEEVEKHTAKDDVWFVVKNKVYDGTKFLDDHPGGGSSILIVGGTDCTEEVTAAVLNRS